eukprot:gb/GECH01001495.1/.p1 GENE.gb/GECH01001495.1/~~gb/GECH01001495.1/.p1  ORF type:complete len:297 (+),score=58.88 gb/GECH01001495.1/:1-891(+)
MPLSLSKSEEEYIIEGVTEDLRADGRGRLDFRGFNIELGIVPQANGSARVKLSTTDVLVGVKVEVGEPDPSFPNEGRLSVYVECSPSAAPEFEGKGGTEELNTQLAHSLHKMLNTPGAIDWQALSILSGKQCWILHVDALVLDSSGNVFDALAMATKGALANTWIPKITVFAPEEGSGGQSEIDVSDDPEDVTRLDTVHVPVSVTLAKVGLQYYVVDPALDEELCMRARLTVSVNKDGGICAIHKGGHRSGLTTPELFEMLQSAKGMGIQLNKTLNEAIEKELNRKTSGDPVGFFH